MRRVLAVLGTAMLVMALGAPAYAGGAKSPSNKPITAMRDHDGGRHGDHDGHGGWRHGDHDRGYRHDRDDRDDRYDRYRYRHHYGYGYRYPYYDDYYYYDGYYGRPTRARCDWAYYNDPAFFDRYCRGYYGYGYYRPYAVDQTPQAAAF